MLLKLFIFTQRHFADPLNENKTFFVKKKIRGFVDSEFVKICHEQVICPRIKINKKQVIR